MKNGPEAPEFHEDSVLGKSGGGADGHVPGSPSNSVAIDRPCKIGTFGYNTKDSQGTLEKHVARERNRL